MFENYNIYINFAHSTFQWKNESPNAAGVHCIIVGFANFEKDTKYLFEYETPKSNACIKKVKNINAYLVEGSNIIISSRTKPLSDIPKMLRGSSPVDNGEYILDLKEKEELELKYPQLKQYIYKYVGAKDFINQNNRYCLWLINIPPKLIQTIPELKQKVDNVRKFRLNSKKEATRKLADFPTLFESNRYVEKDYILIPRHSSEKRIYIPIGFMKKDTIPSDGVQVIPDADIYHFGILTSKMHMTWNKYICGRLKNDFRYSNIVYNNFVFPDLTQQEKRDIEKCAQRILDIRALYKNSSLAELYDPLTMPPDLLKAHQKLDKVVDKAYGCSKVKSDSERMKLLFEMYEELTDGNVLATL